ncbi:NAD(P)/FAD-dependent oxidoreductase [Saccharothrix coeruleofusca]|uniref:Pyridine nucleotide-disulfide oxidoreductase n=1 Tax=Saccharothrix coeruleofusca TaxID=33919 RepID=A0A918ED80_9PSEU|nr:FAD-dependent oxidoreductase [Saccharothrix coeruleofusca]GGP55142.1 pyridine nucleotide-disulfide oxidoreductase [Saccharothrix coeruleofusca]
MSDNIVVVGGGAAGISAVEALRREGFTGRLALVAGEPGPPVDRPPLSKQVLSGQWPLERARLRADADFEALDVAVVRDRATGLDLDGRRLLLEDADPLPYDGLVVATGVTPLRLPFGHDLAGVHVLRGAHDVAGLRESLATARHLVVVGAGFLGTEVAATAAGLGHRVTVVDLLPLPLVAQLGETVAGRVAQLHRDRGVELRTGVGVSGFVASDGRVSGVALTDGTVLEAECVLVAIGSRPAVDWLRSSGLDLADGVVCDRFCRAAPGVYAAGDVASWPNPRFGRRMRVEHRGNAGEQGQAAAVNLLHGDTTSFSPLPYFWTDQYDVKIQAYGLLGADAEVEVVDGSPEGSAFVALYRVGGRLTGALAWNAFKPLRRYRGELAALPFPTEGAVV